MAGVDEVGRGPLAGPVVAAAVILDPRRPVRGLKDSKCLPAARRLELARQIRRRALGFAVAAASPAEVDEHNILQASLLAMERAVLRLKLAPDLIRVDGNQIPRFEGCGRRYMAEPVVGGDGTVPCISAASILAKVCRDRLMQRMHRNFPGYGFDTNKGYGTPEHLTALDRIGPCVLHRTTFAPVHAWLARGEA